MPEQDAELLVRDIFGRPLSCPLDIEVFSLEMGGHLVFLVHRFKRFSEGRARIFPARFFRAIPPFSTLSHGIRARPNTMTGGAWERERQLPNAALKLKGPCIICPKEWLKNGWLDKPKGR
jgi:hypothetical protein